MLLLPSFDLHACISNGQFPQLSFERLPLLVAPLVDRHLNATSHRDAQVDAHRRARAAGAATGWVPADDIKAFTLEACSSDYYHLLETVLRTVETI